MAKQKKYYRIDRTERISIERALDKKESARSIARSLLRSQSSITDEVKRNRVVTKGPGKDKKVETLPEDMCIQSYYRGPMCAMDVSIEGITVVISLGASIEPLERKLLVNMRSITQGVVLTKQNKTLD